MRCGEREATKGEREASKGGVLGGGVILLLFDQNLIFHCGRYVGVSSH